jgi:hypothetical protein
MEGPPRVFNCVASQQFFALTHAYSYSLVYVYHRLPIHFATLASR